MEYTKKELFISITLSLLFGFITHIHSMESEPVYAYEYLLDSEETTVSEYIIKPETNEGDALRHFSKTKRISTPSSSKSELAFIKGNSIPYTSSITLESTQRFHSGLGEGRKRLINFGVLII